MTLDQDIKTALPVFYSLNVEERKAKTPADWKIAEREAFLGQLLGETCRLLVIGAGTGPGSVVFRDLGYRLVRHRTVDGLSSPMRRTNHGLRRLLHDSLC